MEKIPLRSNWNLKLFRDLCTSDYDRQVLTYLTYGWPLNRQGGPVAKTFVNHRSAVNYSEQVTKYIIKELGHGTLLGPSVSSPFPAYVTGVSPMSTVPKKDSEARRVIVDLSWPIKGDSVNSRIPKDSFEREAS